MVNAERADGDREGHELGEEDSLQASGKVELATCHLPPSEESLLGPEVCGFGSSQSPVAGVILLLLREQPPHWVSFLPKQHVPAASLSEFSTWALSPHLRTFPSPLNPQHALFLAAIP